MTVLVACEYSGVVRDAFLRRGVSAMSCDILPTESPGPHYQGDVRDLMGESWEMVIAHPPCTYLSNAGARWLYEPGTRNPVPERWADLEEGADFFALMFQFDTSKLAVENPIQHKHATVRHGQGGPTQYIQPWQFGHMESKKTGLWLRGLPPLKETRNVYSEMMALPVSQRQRVWYASPGPDRQKDRSRFYEGVAEAMADQWC